MREKLAKYEQIRQDITLLEQSKAGDFSIMLDGKQYTERPAAGDAFALLYRTINENHAKDDFEFEIGSTVDLGSALTFIRFRGESSCGEPPGTVRTSVLLDRERLPALRTLQSVSRFTWLILSGIWRKQKSSWRLPVSRWASLLFMRKNCPKRLLL